MSRNAIPLKGKSPELINKKIIRFIKIQLKTITVSNIVSRMGYTTRQGLYFHLNEKNAAKANRDILEKIIDAIEAEKSEQQKKEQRSLKSLNSKIKLSA